MHVLAWWSKPFAGGGGGEGGVLYPPNTTPEPQTSGHRGAFNVSAGCRGADFKIGIKNAASVAVSVSVGVFLLLLMRAVLHQESTRSR